MVRMLAVVSLGVVLVSSLGGCGGSSSEPPENDTIWAAASEGRVEHVKAAVRGGMDIDATFVAEGVPGSGGSALHIASLAGQAEVVSWLIGAGADLEVRARDEFGGAPLHWAAAAGQLRVVKLLLDAGADVNAADANGFTPLDATLAGLSGDAEALEAVREELVLSGGESGAED